MRPWKRQTPAPDIHPIRPSPCQAASADLSPVKWLLFWPATLLEAPQRTPVRGPTFIRLLARLIDADVPPSHPSLSDRLSQWIDWTRAVALSRALGGTPSAAGLVVPVFDSTEEEACLRTRSSLANAIAGGDRLGDAHATVDYTVFGQHYLSMQRAMQIATGRLRGRLRDMLAGTSPELARLAAIDALMEGVLSPREHRLLAAVPALLGTHFERLRHAAHSPAPAATDKAWLEAFRRDMQGVLLAELDVRFLPIEGLLAALRTHPQETHVTTFA